MRDVADGYMAAFRRKGACGIPLFQDLQIWQKAHHLVLDAYKASGSLPAEERYSLKRQMRRAAYSIPASIAEGQRRGTDKDFAQFPAISAGSLAELQYYLVLVGDLGYVAEADVRRLISEAAQLERMLAAFHATVQARAARRGEIVASSGGVETVKPCETG